MEQLIYLIAQFFGVRPEVIVALIPTIVFIFNFLARVIPDDSTGFLGFARRACVVLGLYASNRVTSGITVNDLANYTKDEIVKVPSKPEPNGYVITYGLAWLLAIGLGAILLLGGCTTTAEAVCKHQDEVRAAAQATLAMVNQCPASGLVSGGVY